MKIIEFNEFCNGAYLLILENETNENKLSLTLLNGDETQTVNFNNYVCSFKEDVDGYSVEVGDIFDEIEEWTDNMEREGWNIDALSDDDYYKAYFLCAYNRWCTIR